MFWNIENLNSTLIYVASMNGLESVSNSKNYYIICKSKLLNLFGFLLFPDCCKI